ncbi:MAG: hypothetical protein J1D87_11665 [Lachnospiraceae bacterium]|nr:hypothetical protein [Lachnospiraceae bacterium]
MNYDLNFFFNLYSELKKTKDFSEYEREIITNNAILNSIPFDKLSAESQIDTLVSKYKDLINAAAYLTNNGRHTTTATTNNNKSSQEIWNDLNYLNQLIPWFALERTGELKLLENIIKKLSGQLGKDHTTRR